MPNRFTDAMTNSFSDLGDSMLLAAEGRRQISHDIANAIGRLFQRSKTR